MVSVGGGGVHVGRGVDAGGVVRRGAEVELFDDEEVFDVVAELLFDVVDELEDDLVVDVPLGSLVSLVSCSGRSCTGGGSEGAAATRKPNSTSSGTHSSATSSRPSRPISRPVPMAVDPTDGA
ncbi:hypothetical protein B277_06333 [Janibacter hoylei PVAS-1]|uniref:Uncharacterized protein n=1 Tax=Janibacter hoylei PVAS-1 TaxID=1210046 RepID=K1DZ21_9MICO|nr:hypothetical protein B277_06333 [Janibacter hoylei PVAS-1]